MQGKGIENMIPGRIPDKLSDGENFGNRAAPLRDDGSLGKTFLNVLLFNGTKEKCECNFNVYVSFL